MTEKGLGVGGRERKQCDHLFFTCFGTFKCDKDTDTIKCYGQTSSRDISCINCYIPFFMSGEYCSNLYMDIS